jgi:hypothetical protein
MAAEPLEDVLARHSLSQYMSTDATVPTTVGPTFAQLFGPVFWGACLLYPYLPNEKLL